MTKTSNFDRRRFLKGLGQASVATGAAAVLTSASVEEAQAYDPGAQELRQRYNPDSPDVRAFYRTNEYETLKK